MTESKEEYQRISEQVTSLSTQLIESIDKQSLLEEKLNLANKKIKKLQYDSVEYNEMKTKFDEQRDLLNDKNTELVDTKEQLAEESKLRKSAESEVEKLSLEVEDLTESLFSEANNMVADARRDKHTTEILNTKLIEQLKEKDNLLETLNLQLKNLKKVIQTVETENSSQKYNSRYSVYTGENASIHSLSRTHTQNSFPQDLNSSIIYSPNISAIRYDTVLYNEFLKFVAVLPYYSNLKDTSSDSKLIRRLVNDEITPVLKIDNAPGIGWLAKKSLLSTMMEGLVVVEPLSGVNETYQYGSQITPGSTPKISSDKNSHLFNYPSDSPPVAVHEACALCGESRDESIDHARLYVLKTLSKSEDGNVSVTNSYPLCRCCLLKVRQTCEIFSFLRSLSLGAWNLEKVTLKIIAKGDGKFSEVTKAPKPNKKEENRTKRKSFMAGLGINPSVKSTPQIESTGSGLESLGHPTTNLQRAWLQLCKLRSILHWTHMGIWSVDDSVSSKIGPTILDSNNKDDLKQSAEDQVQLKSSLEESRTESPVSGADLEINNKERSEYVSEPQERQEEVSDEQLNVSSEVTNKQEEDQKIKGERVEEPITSVSEKQKSQISDTSKAEVDGNAKIEISSTEDITIRTAVGTEDINEVVTGEGDDQKNNELINEQSKTNEDSLSASEEFDDAIESQE